MKIPVSLLSSYLYCPRKVFLQKVLMMREPLRQPLILGTIRHEAMERAAVAEKGIVMDIKSSLDWIDLRQIYEASYREILGDVVRRHAKSLRSLDIELLDAFDGAFPALQREAKDRSMNLHRFMQKCGLFGEDLWEHLTPKLLSEVKVESNNLGLVGVVDRIEDYGDALVPVEFKTGRAPREGMWPGHRIQASAYAMILGEMGQKQVSSAIVHYLDANEKRAIAMNPFLREEVVMLVDEIKQLLGNALIPDFCGSKNKCSSCSLRKRCYDEEEVNGLISSLAMPGSFA